METFSWGGAWSFGVRFLADRWLHHAIILIGFGLVPSLLLQYAVSAGMAGPADPAIMGQGGLVGAPAVGAASLLVALGYVLQTASYFASWRRGLGAGGSLGGAIVYGLIAGVLAMAVCAGLVMLAAGAASQIESSGAWLLAAFALLIPLAVAFALFYTVFAALVATGLSLALVLAMLFGAATGQVGLAATLVGGSGMIAVVLLVMSAVLLWLAARFSCATSVMADRRSFRLISAMRESWRLTWEEQWSVVRYLALIGFGLALVILGIGALIGAGTMAILQREALPEDPAVSAALGLALGLPLAFLAAMVPAGIYRELNRSTVAAEVFA